MVGPFILTVFLFTWLLTVAANPFSRWNHATVLINNKLYLFGGQVAHNPYDSSNPFLNATDSSELWILDMTQSFDTASPPWTPGPSGGPQTSFMTADYGGPEYELLVIYGDPPNPTLLSTDDNNDVYYYNIIDGQWLSSVDLSPSHPRRRTGPNAVNRINDSSIIMYGGAIFDTNNTLGQLSDMWSLDTIRKVWTPLSSVDMSQTRYDHSSTLLSDGKMYLIGGFTGTSMIDMNNIDIFDTLTMSWTTKKASGDTITQRRIHKAVGTSDNKIIIFGGTDSNYSTSFNDVAVLDSTTLIWKAQPTSGTAPPARYAHTMTMVGTNVIITYGATNRWNEDVGFFVLDTTSTPYTWKTTYTPKNLDKTLKIPPSSGDNPGHSPSWVIPTAVTTSIVLLVALSIGIFIFIKKYREDNDVTGFPGSEMMFTESITTNRSSFPPDNLSTSQSSITRDNLSTYPLRFSQDSLATKVVLPSVPRQ